MPDLPVIKRSDIVIDSKSRVGEGQFVRCGYALQFVGQSLLVLRRQGAEHWKSVCHSFFFLNLQFAHARITFRMSNHGICSIQCRAPYTRQNGEDRSVRSDQFLNWRIYMKLIEIFSSMRSFASLWPKFPSTLASDTPFLRL